MWRIVSILAVGCVVACGHGGKYSASGAFGGVPSARSPHKQAMTTFTGSAPSASTGAALGTDTVGMQPPDNTQAAAGERQNVAGKSCPVADVRFGFASSRLDTQAKSTLDESARCLNEDQALRVRIEGNADERGSNEYNYTLGEQRAETARQYLEKKGVPSERVIVVSFGKDRPLCMGHEESCWQRNRRALVRPGASDEASIPRPIR